MNQNDHPLEMISALLDGEITPSERALVEAHLHACAACRALAGDLTALAAAVACEPVPPVPAGLAARIARRVSSTSEREASHAAAGASRGGDARGGDALDEALRPGVARPVSTGPALEASDHAGVDLDEGGGPAQAGRRRRRPLSIPFLGSARWGPFVAVAGSVAATAILFVLLREEVPGRAKLSAPGFAPTSTDARDGNRDLHRHPPAGEASSATQQADHGLTQGGSQAANKKEASDDDAPPLSEPERERLRSGYLGDLAEGPGAASAGTASRGAASGGGEKGAPRSELRLDRPAPALPNESDRRPTDRRVQTPGGPAAVPEDRQKAVKISPAFAPTDEVAKAIRERQEQSVAAGEGQAARQRNAPAGQAEAEGAQRDQNAAGALAQGGPAGMESRAQDRLHDRSDAVRPVASGADADARDQSGQRASAPRPATRPMAGGVVGGVVGGVLGGVPGDVPAPEQPPAGAGASAAMKGPARVAAHADLLQASASGPILVLSGYFYEVPDATLAGLPAVVAARDAASVARAITARTGLAQGSVVLRDWLFRVLGDERAASRDEHLLGELGAELYADSPTTDRQTQARASGEDSGTGLETGRPDSAQESGALATHPAGSGGTRTGPPSPAPAADDSAARQWALAFTAGEQGFAVRAQPGEGPGGRLRVCTFSRAGSVKKVADAGLSTDAGTLLVPAILNGRHAVIALRIERYAPDAAGAPLTGIRERFVSDAQANSRPPRFGWKAASGPSSCE